MYRSVTPVYEHFSLPVRDVTYRLGREVPTIVGYEEGVRLTCPLHGEASEFDRGVWLPEDTAEFCGRCRDELCRVPNPGPNWTRTDEEMRQDARAEREMFARLER